MNEPTQEMPWSYDSEVVVLGAAFLDPEAVSEVQGMLTPDMFFRDAHRMLWRSIVGLHNQGEALDIVAVVDRMGADAERAGGLEYAAQLMTMAASAANVRYHARVVRGKADLRRLIEACRTTVSDALEDGADPEAVVQLAEERIMGPSQRHTASDYVQASQSVMEAMEYIEEAQRSPDGITGMRTGFPWLDKLTGGLRKGDLTILAARPAMGKSAMGWQFARNTALLGPHVAIASYEMSRARLFHRGLAAEAGINSHRLRTGDLAVDDHRRIAEAAGKLSRMPIHIQYPPPRTVEALRSDLRRLKRKHPVDLFVVDYLQQMDGRGQNRNNQVEHISRNLKRIATDMDVAVVALAQLSRGVEHRQPPRPMLSDLRDSGAIEQDADNVLLLWRPEEYFDDTTPVEQYDRWRDKGELIVAKQRDGETGRVILGWDGPTTSFREIDTTQVAQRNGNRQPEWIQR
jgi:replicative DNA helicase